MDMNDFQQFKSWYNNSPEDHGQGCPNKSSTDRCIKNLGRAYFEAFGSNTTYQAARLDDFIRLLRQFAIAVEVEQREAIAAVFQRLGLETEALIVRELEI